MRLPARLNNSKNELFDRSRLTLLHFIFATLILQGCAALKTDPSGFLGETSLGKEVVHFVGSSSRYVTYDIDQGIRGDTLFISFHPHFSLFAKEYNDVLTIHENLRIVALKQKNERNYAIYRIIFGEWRQVGSFQSRWYYLIPLE